MDCPCGYVFKRFQASKQPSLDNQSMSSCVGKSRNTACITAAHLRGCGRRRNHLPQGRHLGVAGLQRCDVLGHEPEGDDYADGRTLAGEQR